MRKLLTRFITTSVMLLALLAPFASGWAMALGIADGRILVICTGDGLRTIYVDQNGVPTELSSTAEVCTLKSAADTATPVRPVAPADRILFVAEPLQFALPPLASDLHLAARPRAPPMI